VIRNRLRMLSWAGLLLVSLALVITGMGYRLIQQEKSRYDDLRGLRETLIELNAVTLDMLYDTTLVIRSARWRSVYRDVGRMLESFSLPEVSRAASLDELHGRLGERMERFFQARLDCGRESGEEGATVSCRQLLARLTTQVRSVLQDLFAETAALERKATHSMDRYFYLGGLLLLALLVLLSLLTLVLLLPTSRRLERGLDSLVRAADRFSRGDLDHRVVTDARDELGLLADTFNEMAGRRKAVEEELHAKEHWLSRLLDTIPYGVQENDLGGRITYSNIAHHRMLGFAPGELVGRHIWDLLPDEKSREEMQRAFCALIEEQPEPRSIRNLNITADGRKVLLEVTWDYLRDGNGELTGFISVIADVTERVAAEEALRRSEANLAEAQQVAHVGSWELDLVNNRLWWSDEIYRIFGIDPQRFGASYEAFLERVHPEDREKVDAAYRRSVADRTSYEIVHRLLLDDGRVRYVHERGRTHYDTDGAPLRSIGTVQDVTGQQLAHRALKESERELDAIIENLPLMIFLKDAESLRFVRFNRAGEELLGIPRERLIGRRDHDFFPAEQADAFVREDRRVLETGKILDIALEPVDTAQGRRYLHTRKVCIRNEAGEPRYLLGISEDITQRVEAEDRVRYRLSLEAAMAHVSSELARAAEEDLDDVLDRALEEIGQAVGADRSYLFQVDVDGTTFTNTHEWCKPGVMGQKADIQQLPIADFEAAFQRFRQGEILYVSDPLELDDRFATLRAFMQESGIRALVNVPLLAEGRLLGVVGFDAESDGKVWPEEDVRLLRIVAEAVAGTLIRLRATRAIREHTWYLEGLDRISRVLAEHNSQQGMLRAVADLVLELFQADRAWMLQVAPAGETGYEVPIECTRPEYPGAIATSLKIPDDDFGRRMMALLLEAREPVVMQLAEVEDLPEYMRSYEIRSQMLFAVKPSLGTPWILGIHQCSRERDWSPVERRLFRSIAERLGIALVGVRLMEGIRQSEQRLQEAEKIARVGTWELDLVSGEAYWSDQEYLCLGYEPGSCEAGRAAFMKAVHPDDREAVQRAMEAALEGASGVYEIQHRVVWQDGSEHVVHELGKVIRGGQGAPLRMIGTTQDVTRRVALEKELQRHRRHLEQLVEERTRTIRRQTQIIEQTNDSVVTTDMEGRVTSWNGGAVRVFGYSVEEATGRHIGFVYPEEDRERLGEWIMQPLLGKGTHETEALLRRKDGSCFPAYLSISLLYDETGMPDGMVGYAVDVSELKKREQELQQLAERLEASNRELESFSYSVSHDLRAPLRAIDGFSQALVEDYADRLDGEALDYLSRIRGGAQRLGTLIDDLLQLSRVNRGKLQLQEVDLAELARSVIEELQAGEPQRKMELVLGSEMAVEGDPRLLRALVSNLLGNAWKFTAGREKARIVFRRMEREPHVFYIQDNGVGFDMRHADKLFGAFQRLHRTSEFPGTGIGLATVQRIVHRHGGRVWAEATPGEGATFYFSLDPGPQESLRSGTEGTQT